MPVSRAGPQVQPQPRAPASSEQAAQRSANTLASGRPLSVREANRIASELHLLVKPGLRGSDARRLERMRSAIGGLDAPAMEQVRTAYIRKFNKDPEIDIRGFGIGQVAPRNRRTVEAMVELLNGPRIRSQVEVLHGLLEKQRAGKPFTTQDRQTFFRTMAEVGFPHGRSQLEREFKAKAGRSLESTLERLHAVMPPADAIPSTPASKNVAVVLSSQGAQWQELMDWAMPLIEAGYNLQVFTPDGKPVAYQHDSLLYSAATSKVGFGAPPHLRVDGPVGRHGMDLAANAAPADSFDPKHFAQVMVVGGLGTDRDLTNHPSIHGLVARAFEQGLDLASICHGPTVFAKTMIDGGNGRREPLARGMDIIGLPNQMERAAIASGRVHEFYLDPPPIDVRKTLEAAGANMNRLVEMHSVVRPSRVVVDEKAGRQVATGVGPLAARNLGLESLRMLEARHAEPRAAPARPARSER